MTPTVAEAELILSLLAESLPPDAVKGLLRQLDEGVGQASGSWWLRETLAMLRAMAGA